MSRLGIQSVSDHHPIDDVAHDDTDQCPVDYPHDDTDQRPVDHTYDGSLSCYHDRDDCGALSGQADSVGSNSDD